MAGRRRRRASAYPTFAGDVSHTSSADDGETPFGSQPDLGGTGGGGAAGMTGGIYINNVNQAIANAQAIHGGRGTIGGGIGGGVMMSPMMMKMGK